MRTHRRSRQLIFAIVPMLVVASCGSDDESEGTTAPSAAPTTVASTTVATTEASPPDTEAPGTDAQASTDAPASTAAETSVAPETTAAPPTEPANQDPYRITWVGDQTGVQAFVGTSGLGGFQTVLKRINDGGGVDGHPVEFDVIDLQSTPEGAQAGIRQAIESEPDLIVHCGTSSTVPAMAELLESSGLTFFTCTSSEALVYPEPKPWYFQVSGPAWHQAAVMTAGAKAQVGGSLEGKRIAISGVATASTDAFIAAEEALIEAEGGEVVIVERDEVTLASYASQAANIAAAEPDVVLIVTTPTNAVIVSQALATAGVTAPLILGEGASADVTLEKIGLENAYVIRTAIELKEGDPLYAQAEAAGQGDSGVDSFFFTRSVVMADIIETVLAECGFPCDQPAFTSTIEGMGEIDIADQDILFGPVQDFDATHHYAHTTSQFFHWDPAEGMGVPAGEPIDVRPLEPAT